MNKNFKKLGLLVLLIGLILSLAGCASKEKQLIKALEKFEDETSCQVLMTLEVSGMSMEVLMKIDGNKTQTEIDVFGSKVVSYTELDEETNIITTYQQLENEWYITKTENPNSESILEGLTPEDFVYDEELEKYVAEDIELAGLLDSMGDMFEGMGEVDFKDVRVELTLEDGIVSVMDINFKLSMDGMSVNYAMTMTFSEYGNVTITIPEEAYNGTVSE
ncbi:MAG: hypothetical protein IJX78_07840 [Bacilli bacterium]|nr:hypothetical protein [Bacilli bacterium]